MAQPVFRNPDKFQVLPFREWLREKKPSGKEGYVVEDLDLVIRLYGTQYRIDDQGHFALFELKFGESWIGVAQKRTFGLIHNLLRKADPEHQRYKGYFVIQYDNEDWDKANFRANRTELTRDQFFGLLDLDADIISFVGGSLFDDPLEKLRPPDSMAEEWDQLIHQTT